MENTSSSMSPVVYTDLSSLQHLKSQSRDNPNAAIKEVAQHFESLFVSMMLKSMREALPEDSLFGSTHMQTYQEMFDQQLALDLSQNGGLGLADLIEKQLGMLKDMEAEPVDALSTSFPLETQE